MSSFSQGGEILIVDTDMLGDIRRVDALIAEGAAVRLETTEGDVTVEVDGPRVILTAPSDLVAP